MPLLESGIRGDSMDPGCTRDFNPSSRRGFAGLPIAPRHRVLLALCFLSGEMCESGLAGWQVSCSRLAPAGRFPARG